MSRYYRSFLVESGSSYTSRTTSFASATGITDTTILNALNTFDLGLISNGLDTKMKALYPFVGGTATTHKYNFMDARDLDVAYRLQFNGGWTHSSTGALPNGTNTYADTYLIPNILTQNSNHISYYSRTSAASTGHDFGALGVSLNERFEMLIRYIDNNAYTTLMSTLQVGVPVTDGMAFWISSRNNSTQVAHFRNNLKIATTSQNSVSPSDFTMPCYIGASNRPTPSYSAKECAMCTVGNGLSDTDASNLYTLVQAFQTALSRQV